MLLATYTYITIRVGETESLETWGNLPMVPWLGSGRVQFALLKAWSIHSCSHWHVQISPQILGLQDFTSCCCFQLTFPSQILFEILLKSNLCLFSFSYFNPSTNTHTCSIHSWQNNQELTIFKPSLPRPSGSQAVAHFPKGIPTAI